MSMYYGLDGEPIGMETWAALMERKQTARGENADGDSTPENDPTRIASTEGFKTLAHARVEMQISDLDRLTADVIDRAKKLIEADRQKLPLHLFVVDLDAMVNSFEAAS